MHGGGIFVGGCDGVGDPDVCFLGFGVGVSRFF